MRPHYFIFFFLILTGFFGCSPQTPDIGIAEHYLPHLNHLKEGIINKYYFHYKSNDGFDNSTTIEYKEYILTRPNELTINNYNPAFELVNSTVYEFQDNKMFTKKNSIFFRSDTLSSEILSPLFIDWNDSSPPSTYRSRFTYNFGTERTTVIEKKFKKDTTILNKPAKIYSHTLIRKDTTEQKETSSLTGKYEAVYVGGIGLYTGKGELDEGATFLELIEQIPQKKFRQLKNHQVKRVGYINPDERLDKEKKFSTCNSIDVILDYYNDSKSTRYPGGKKALWESILPQIDKSKMHLESGYLTFRFVINCQGDAGRYIIEETALDFSKKQFNPETVGHLYNIVKNLKGWQPPFIRKEYQDTYNYLTFKLKDGEIVELLP
ncbi:MAG: hypothetical protein AAFZ15_06995 [Bacteroidota bacterium]